MDVLERIVKHLDAEDASLTARLRFDKVDTDRTRNQAVGRVKQIEELKQFILTLRVATPEDDGLEEIDTVGAGAQSDPGEKPQKKVQLSKPRRW